MNANELITVAVFSNGKEPKLKEIIRDLLYLEENEHCISVTSVYRKGKRSRINKQMFSKPEFFFIRISEEAGYDNMPSK